MHCREVLATEHGTGKGATWLDRYSGVAFSRLTYSCVQKKERATRLHHDDGAYDPATFPDALM